MTGGCFRPEEVLGFQCQDVNRTTGTFSVRRVVTHPDRNQPVVKEAKTEQSVRTIQLDAEDDDVWKAHGLGGGRRKLSELYASTENVRAYPARDESGFHHNPQTVQDNGGDRHL